MRKLVTLRKISDVQPIPGADSIEVVSVDGWKVVVRKGEFKPDDLCVYFEIDCFLPKGDSRWDFLVEKSSKKFEGEEGHVLKTVKIRKQISQGLVFPLNLFPEILDHLGLTDFSQIRPEWVKTDDYADLLGVVKYDPVTESNQALASDFKCQRPSFVPKTDQERAQNIGDEIFADLDAKYEITLKMDGSSMSVYHYNGEVGVCSRNMELKTDDPDTKNMFARFFLDHNIGDRLRSMGKNFVIQGELCGPKIQGNPDGFEQNSFFIFDVFDIDANRYLTPNERYDVCYDFSAMMTNVSHIPVLCFDESINELNIRSMPELIDFANVKGYNSDVAEGVVFKRIDGNFSFKVISNQYLLKGNQ